MHDVSQKMQLFLKNIKKSGRRHGKFSPRSLTTCYCALCVPIPTPPACTARNCDIYRDVWEGKFLEDRFLKVFKYLLGGKKKAEGDGILCYLELHFQGLFHYFNPKREYIPQAMMTFNRLVPRTGWVYL